MSSILVIGGGPSGLAAAIFAAYAGASVALCERNDHCGMKLLTTGGGHANISNTQPVGEWPALFGKRGRFILPAMEFLPLERLCNWFSRIGVPLVCTDGFHYFPASNSAKSVRDALVACAGDLGITIRTSARITTIPGEYDAVIIATGGKSIPATGSTGDGWTLARQLGHTVKPARPGLVGLQAKNIHPELAGLVLPDAEVILSCKGRQKVVDRGELLVTHTGFSGPAILDISATVADAVESGGETIPLTIRWVAGKDTAFWRGQLDRWRTTHGTTPLTSLLREAIPLRLARWLCRSASMDDGGNTPASLKAGHRDALARNMGDFQALITGTDGWNKAMITRGGVDTGKINPASLESRLAKKVYFVGETLDIDGPCGGYNLHWAFASGALAGHQATGKF